MIHNEILTNMLKSANLTKASCSKLLNTHKNSLKKQCYIAKCISTSHIKILVLN